MARKPTSIAGARGRYVHTHSVARSAGGGTVFPLPHPRRREGGERLAGAVTGLPALPRSRCVGVSGCLFSVGL